jgi:hypothetical protein
MILCVSSFKIFQFKIGKNVYYELMKDFQWKIGKNDYCELIVADIVFKNEMVNNVSLIFSH